MNRVAAGRLQALGRSFFEQPVVELAASLLGQLLVRRSGDGLRVGRIVETEAYGGQGIDDSSHAFRGPTPRCLAMFGPAGHAYIYFTHGSCYCFNAVAEGNGDGRAVLIRAVEPLLGVALMRRRRLSRLAEGPTRRRLLDGNDHELARGPGRLCVSFDLDRRLDRHDLTDARGTLFLAGGEAPACIRWTPRIGMNQRAATSLWRWRAMDPGSAAVSLPRGEPERRPQPGRCPGRPLS